VLLAADSVLMMLSDSSSAVKSGIVSTPVARSCFGVNSNLKARKSEQLSRRAVPAGAVLQLAIHRSDFNASGGGLRTLQTSSRWVSR